MIQLPSLEQTSALIRHRRSIKPTDFDPTQEVGRDLLMQILEDATWAPNHGMTEPWRFTVFTGESRQKIGELLQQAYREVTQAEDYREDKFQKFATSVFQAPVIIACHLEPKGGSKIPLIEEVEAVACALQNLQLSATAAGLGCYWSSPPAVDAPSFRSALELGKYSRCVGLIYLGWPRSGLVWPRSSRRPIQEKVKFLH